MNIDFLSTDQFSPGAQDGVIVLLIDDVSSVADACARFGEGVAQAAAKAAKVTGFEGKRGEKIDLMSPVGLRADRLILWSLGKRGDIVDREAVEIGGAIMAAVQNSGSKTVAVIDEDDQLDMTAIAEGMSLRSYRFDKYRTTEPQSKKPSITAVQIFDSSKAADRFAARAAVVDGVNLTRDLCSEPPNVLHPESFADRVREMQDLGLEVTILGEDTLAEMGFAALLGVGVGSEKMSQVAVMHWKGAGDDSAPLALIGKGVTFDTGGISIKPSDGMDQMKWDMGGAGLVTGAMCALAKRKAKANIVGLIGLVENMPDGKAQRPGDVVTSLSGQTIEVLNTDAEGRLVLADVLWYAKETFNPHAMIDFATLTGAIIVALGHEYAGLFSNDDALSGKITAAGEATGDKVWRFPLHKNYDKLIDTPTADMKNIGGRGAGSITAAQFLQRFVGDVPWAHVDVAGTMWTDKNLPLSEKGATGFGVRLVDSLVADNFEK